MKLNLGCGKRYMKGWVNIDNSAAVKTDRFYEIGGYDSGGQCGFQFAKAETVDVINARAFLAHILREHLPFVMDECWRVLKPGGCMFLMVPYAGSDAYYSDPTHHTGFTLETLKHFTQWAHDRRDADYGWDCKFEIPWYHVSTNKSFISAWLKKPGNDVGKTHVNWDDEVKAFGIYPNGYMYHHTQV